jgi:pyruvate dehydrogenase E2 component (dihydrolipoamide acetyltransferase)
LTQVKGSGENGRIVKSDVENFTPAAPVLQHQLLSCREKHRLHCTRSKVFVPAGEVLTEEIKNSQMRKIIESDSESLFTAPHYNLTIEVTMDDAMKSRLLLITFLIQKFLLMIWSSKHALWH